MIFEVFGTLFTFLVLLQNPCESSPSLFVLAHLPKFNPAVPKLQELGEDSQGFQSKSKKVNSVPNTSKINLPHGFKYEQIKLPLDYKDHTIKFLNLQNAIFLKQYLTYSLLIRSMPFKNRNNTYVKKQPVQNRVLPQLSDYFAKLLPYFFSRNDNIKCPRSHDLWWSPPDLDHSVFCQASQQCSHQRYSRKAFFLDFQRLGQYRPLILASCGSLCHFFTQYYHFTFSTN